MQNQVNRFQDSHTMLSSSGSSNVTPEAASRQNSAHLPFEAGHSNSKDVSKAPKQIQKSVQGFEPIPKKSAIIKTDKPRPHICTTCTRAFARYEHLKRHERSHTNEKPFQCAACGRCFARRDLVLRHQQKLHTTLATNKDSFKKGENSNIITNYGNKEVTLPTMGEEGPIIINEASHIPKNNKHRRMSHQQHQLQSSDQSPSINSSISPSDKTDTPLSALSPESVKIPNSAARSSIDSLQNEMNPSLFNSSLNNGYSSFHHQPAKRHRHNSFSASSSISYTKGGARPLMSNSHESPEGPKQVGFATPQLSAQELDSRALQTGIDLNALGLQYEIEEFNLDNTKDYFNGSHHNSSNDIQAHRNAEANTASSRVGTPNALAMTPGRLGLDFPVLNEYLSLGNAGGGAGFISRNVSSMNLFNHEKKKRKRVSGANTPSDANNLNLTLHNQSSSTSTDPTSTNPETASTSIQNDTSSPEDWLEEFINTPFEANFVSNSKNLNTIGFASSISPATSNNNQLSPLPLSAFSGTNNISSSSELSGSISNDYSPSASLNIPRKTSTASNNFNINSPQSTSSNGIPSLFRTRQIDLFHKEVENDVNDLKLFSKELRDQILQLNNLVDSQFPSLEELNKYVYLYKTEFDKYFPFIHLATLTPSLENYPLLLSVASVGALYRFHSTHAMLLFNISRFRVHEFLEKEKKNFKNDNSSTTSAKDEYHARANSVPIWVYQSMVLLIFIGIFNNDLSITKTMAMFLNSLIELVKITALNHPLENFLTPPPVIDDSSVDELIQEQNFNYFILAQTRIRTCHTILLVSNLFTSLIGLDCSLHSIDLKCGIHCKWEDLWECSNYKEWSESLNVHHYRIDSKFSLIELSNGNDSYTNCLGYLSLNNFILNDDEQLNKKFQMKTLLSLLLSIHEKIYLERVSLKDETNGIIAATKWRMNSRPVIESLIKGWESLYIKNGGVFYLNEQSLHSIYNKNPILRLILPLLSLAKIRKCIGLTSIIEKIWQKDWDGMNENLQKLRDDPEALKDATNYALDIVKLWIDYVSIHQDAEKTSLRTPVFFITCIFTSLLIIAEFLLSLEINASKVKELNHGFLNANERTLWLRSEMVFKKVENCLVLNDNNKTYAEFLRLDAKGALDVQALDDEVATRAVNPNTDIHETAQVIKNARLSSRSLYLGVRILADAPIWPIALLFAQALKARAIHISKSQPSSPSNS